MKIQLPAQNNSDRIHRAIITIRNQGLSYYAQNYAAKWSGKAFFMNKKRAKIKADTWKEINFEALGLKGSGRLLLNPSDTGFSKEFSVYGFREPLNTFALFGYVSKNKPTVLDVGGNLGYFCLVELEAGAREVVAFEPVPSTFRLLSKTLRSFKHVNVLNLAVSDVEGRLPLYVSADRNVTSSSKQLIGDSGHKVESEILVHAETLRSIVDKYPVNMIRIDVEGHEYRIFSGKIPDQISAINMELHVISPFRKSEAIALLSHLREQGFHAYAVVNEMSYAYYNLVGSLGLTTAYKLATAFGRQTELRPFLKVNPSFEEVISRVPKKGVVHLILHR